MPSRVSSGCIGAGRAAAVFALLVVAACEIPGPEHPQYQSYASLGFTPPAPSTITDEYWPDSLADNRVSCDGGSSSCVGLSVFLPSGATGPRPTIVYAHGGGFVTGERNEPVLPASGDNLFLPVGEVISAQTRAERGWIVIAIDYPLSYQLTDVPTYAYVQQAVRHVKTMTLEGDAQVDPGKVVLAGSSAGGTLAMLAAMRPDQGQLPPMSGSPSSEVRSVVNLDGPTDLGTLTEATGDVFTDLTGLRAALADPQNMDERARFADLYGYVIDGGELTGTITAAEISDAYVEANLGESAASLSPRTYAADGTARVNALEVYQACAGNAVAAPWPFDSFCEDARNTYDILVTRPNGDAITAIDHLEDQNHFTVDAEVNVNALESFLTNTTL